MVAEKKKWVITLFFALILTLLFFLTTMTGFSSSSYFTFTFHNPYTHTITSNGGGVDHPPSFAYYMGSTNLASGLRGAAMLTKIDSSWNWFVMLGAADYPLITRDDMSHVFSSIGKDTNFIDHAGELGWKESQRAQPIIVDPAIYLDRNSQIFKLLKSVLHQKLSRFSLVHLGSS